MRPCLLLAALTGAVTALPKPGPTGPGLDLSSWTVRADWSRCANANDSEVVVQGRIAATPVSAGTGIADFQLPAAPFDASIVFKAVGTVGFGSPYPPSRIELSVRDTPVNGSYATATYTPSAVAATIGNSLAQVAWFSQPNQAFSPASSIEYAALQGTEAVSIDAKVNPSYLRVYYCGAPDPVKA